MNKASLLLCALLVLPAVGQNPTQTPTPTPQDLPEAPSAKLTQKPAPKPPDPPPQQPPAPKPATSVEAKSAEAKPEEKIDTKVLDPEPAPQQTQAQKPAESAIPQNADAVETIKKRVDEVNVIFTVTDKHGRFVKNLKANDFSVLDDKKPPQNIINFRSETDLPLRVGLLIDVSNSIRDRFKFEQEAAAEFLAQIVRPRFDRAFVLGFDTTPEVTADFTDSTDKLGQGIRMLRPGGGTALYDAVYFSCRDKLMKVNAGEAVRRAIILITDGEDNQSRVTREEAIEMAQRAEVIVYAISTNDSGLKGTRGDKVLQRMAEATGGRAFFPFKLEDIANYFTDIQEELRSQYALAYKPPPGFTADGSYHSIEILASNRALRVRAKKGYYAPR